MASLRSNRTSTKPERVMPVRLLRKLAMTAEINSITRCLLRQRPASAAANPSQLHEVEAGGPGGPERGAALLVQNAQTCPVGEG